MSKYILSIDQGTTGTTVSILNQQGDLVAKSNQEYPQIFPKPGWVEHNPEDIWQSVVGTIDKTLRLGNIQGSEIAAIGITNQRETVVVWDRKTHQPVYNAIVWQCRRTTTVCDKIKKTSMAKKIQKKTGLVVDPYFSATKIQWILKNVDGVKARAKAGDLAVGTIDTFLLWRLTGGGAHKTDVSNASRTMLLNLHSAQWDADLLKFFGVPKSLLPEVCPSSGVFGVTKGLGVLPDGIPISGIAGDQQAALFGQVCFDQGEAKCTYGTGSFLLLNTGKKPISSRYQLLTTIAWQLPDQEVVYALEGGAFICGAAVQWLRDGLELFSKSAEVEDLASKVSSSEGVEFVPALTGLGAPYWWAEARGMICGLTRGSTKAHVARATLEAMALQNVDILVAMQKDLRKKLKSLKVDGGASANNLLMQLQADYMGMKVSRPELIETTAIGAAYLAGLGVGFWKSTEELKKIWKLEREFKVEMPAKPRSQRLEKWHRAIERVKP
ncbi:MAG: glycerol kinase 2 [Oligoflexia bacterium]|nr:MAG: glycerol kinase 2 [Oligoflexia bacterium]